MRNSKRSASLLILALLALLVVLFVATRETGDEAGLEHGATPETSQPSATSLPPAAEPGRARTAPATESDAGGRRALTDEGRAQPAAPEPALAHVVGRLLLPSGAPAVGAGVRLHGWGANQDRLLKYGRPENWTDPETTTDGDGRFDVELDPPRAFQFTLDVRLAGHAALSWRWSSLPPGEVTDVGEQTLSAAGTIVGRVLRPDGAPASGRWRVRADSSHAPQGPGADETRAYANADPDTGAFRLAGLPSGMVQLRGYARIANWVDGPSVMVEAGRETTVDFVYSGSDNSSRITIVTFCRPFHVFNEPPKGGITCSDGAGGEWSAEKIEGSSQSWKVDDLLPGSYTIRIESERHDPWSRAGVRPGQSIDAHLVGNAAVALTVVDAASGEAVTAYDLKLRFEQARFSPNVFQLREAQHDLPPGGLFDGLIPHPTTLIVEAEGYGPCEVELGELAPNETRAARAELRPGGRLSGVVRYGNGSPAAGVELLLHPHFPGYDPGGVFSGPRGWSARSAFEASKHERTTDARGAFAFEGLKPGKYDLRVWHGAIAVAREGLELRSGSDEILVIELPASGSLVGTLIAPEGASFEGLRVLVYPKGGARGAGQWYHESSDVAQAELDDQGRFRVDDVPAGEATVDLFIPSRMIRTSYSSSGSTGPTYRHLDTVRIPAGGDTRAEFDLRGGFPGTIVVEATLNGAPAAGFVVRASGVMGARRRQASGGQLDAAGRLRVTPLLPGEWTLTIGPLGGPWKQRVPAQTVLGSAGEVLVPVNLVTAPGSVRVFDAATGEPLLHRGLWLGQNTKVTTDGEGWLDLDLPAGNYELCDGQDKPWKMGTPKSSVGWTESGPGQVHVRLDLDGESE